MTLREIRGWDIYNNVMCYDEIEIYQSIIDNKYLFKKMNFIGIRDKNNNMIYEEDIVKLNAFCNVEDNEYDYDFIGVVKFTGSRGYYLKVFKKINNLDCTEEKVKNYKPIVSYRSEIIGNTYQNKELLK